MVRSCNLTPHQRWKVTKVIVGPRNCIFFLEQLEVKGIPLHFFDRGEDWPEMDGVPGKSVEIFNKDGNEKRIEGFWKLRLRFYIRATMLQLIRLFITRTIITLACRISKFNIFWNDDIFLIIWNYLGKKYISSRENSKICFINLFVILDYTSNFNIHGVFSYANVKHRM